MSFPIIYYVTNNGSGNYLISGNDLIDPVSNPTLNLIAGQEYIFNIDAVGHPFWIKTNISTGTGDAYSLGVMNNGIDNGLINFSVPNDAPSTLYYNCEFHSSMAGNIEIAQSTTKKPTTPPTTTTTTPAPTTTTTTTTPEPNPTPVDVPTSNSLKLLMDIYGGGTGNLMLYYDMENFAISDGRKIVKNVSPSSTVGYNDAVLDDGKLITNFHDGVYSGGNLSYSKLTFDTFNNGFLNNEEQSWSASFLFSFTKTHSEDGVLFGCLNKDQYTFTSDTVFSDIEYLAGETVDYGRGFNIGINDRNQLFLQAIDLESGPYLIVADQIELANKNLCSVSLDPFSVTFAYYDLPSDRVYFQTKLTTDRTENILSNEKFYLGSSNFYYKDPGFSGYIDKFAILSGDYNVDQLKSIISGFVSSNVINSGEQGFVTNVTGYNYLEIQQTGVTGYAATLTGSRPVYTTGYFFEKVQSTGAASVSIEEGYRFVSGFTFNNNLGYDEEIGYLYKTDEYITSGNMANATLGLIDRIDIITTGGKTVLRYTVNQTGSMPLYRIDPLTGFLGITGVVVDPLTTQNTIDGAVDSDFYLNTGLMEEYRHNYLYYLMERI